MESGQELVSDLRDLLLMANETLPEIAGRWGAANGELHAHAADSNLFTRKQAISGAHVYGRAINADSVGRVYPHFDALRDELQNIFAESTNNMYDAADALIEIVNEYANADSVARDWLLHSNHPNAIVGSLRRPEVHRAQ